MTLEVDEEGLAQGVLALIVTLVELIQGALETQAIRRIEGGSLTEWEQERLGDALLQLDEAMARLKRDYGLNDAVKTLQAGLNDVVLDLVDVLTGYRADRSAPGG